MTLNLVVDKVPDGLGDHYTEKDGKFHLNVDGIEDTTGLKNALAREKEEAKKFKSENAAFRALGMTAEQIKELKDAKEAAETEAAKKAGNFDGILKQHQDKWSAEKTALENEKTAALSTAKKAIVDAALSNALAKAKATPEGIDLFMQVLPNRVKLDFVDGSQQIEILAADGKSPLAGSGTAGAATYDDLIKDVVKNFPSLFEGTGSGGGGSSPRGNRGAGSKTLTLTEFNALSHPERSARMRDGYTVV